jgi:urease accessory protein
MRLSQRRLTGLLTAILALSPTLALAHTGHGDTHGFVYGFLHPIGGLDHVLAMVAVGLFAAHLGGRAFVLVPGSFVLAMAAGGALGMAGIKLPWVEIVIALSVIVLGAAVALRVNAPVIVAMALVGLFAVFHGYAHGAEMPAAISGLAYGTGFMLATALLHAAGIAVGLLIGRPDAVLGRRLVQVGGGAIALAGVAFLAGVV